MSDSCPDAEGGLAVQVSGGWDALESDESLDHFWRAANYISAAMLYLKDNVLLKRPLRPDDLKTRIVGHWGATPGMTLVFACISDIARRQNRPIDMLVGTGHAACAVLACAYLDGSLAEINPDLNWGEVGLRSLLRAFGSAGGFHSEISARLPMALSANGELGSGFAIAQGAALDRPGSVTVCLIGDGEIETGPTACAWWGGRYLHPRYNGVVLPVINLNRWRMGAASIIGMMQKPEIEHYFYGLGWQPILTGPGHSELRTAFLNALARIDTLAQHAGETEVPRLPVIILDAAKGLGGPLHDADGVAVEGTPRSHKAPLRNPAQSPRELQILEAWLRSYRPGELFDAAGIPSDLVRRCIPAAGLRVGSGPTLAIRCEQTPLAIVNTPSPAPPGTRTNTMSAVGEMLAEALSSTQRRRNFRIFSPDELFSNRLQSVLDVTSLCFSTPGPAAGPPMAASGRVMEILSEHQCIGWLIGYIQTGRHGVLAMYEGFGSIVASPLVQHAKFLQESAALPWRPSRPALNIILSSVAWHNVYSHQNPDLITLMLAHEFDVTRVYVPVDANVAAMQLQTMLGASNRINIMVASKHDHDVLVDETELKEQLDRGFGIWRHGPTSAGREPDIVLAGVGDVAAAEITSAARILDAEMPGLNIRVALVSDLTLFRQAALTRSGSRAESFDNVFGKDSPVLFAFTGYCATLKAMLAELPGSARFHYAGFRDALAGFDPPGTLRGNGMHHTQLAELALGILRQMRREPR
jgi:xylulose-5-phosphate/fructose-6-phosphate phosphoketolase